MVGSTRTPTHLWLVGIVATLWNSYGAYNYLMTQTRNEAFLADATAAQRAYIDSFPAWAEAAWGLGVWGGVLGSLLLLARSRFAAPLFLISLLGIAGTTAFQYALSSPPAEMSSGHSIAVSLAVWAVAIGLLLYALAMRGRGVLR